MECVTHYPSHADRTDALTSELLGDDPFVLLGVKTCKVSCVVTIDTLTYDLCVQQLTEDTANGWNIAAARRVATTEQKYSPELVLTHRHSMEGNFAKDRRRKPSLAIVSHAVSYLIVVVVVVGNCFACCCWKLLVTYFMFVKNVNNPLHGFRHILQ